MPMIDVITRFAVSEQASEGAWSTLAQEVQACVALGMDAEAVGNVLKNAEKEFKAEYDAPLPGAWRSAKSVALKAVRAGIALVDEEQVVGKSAVEKTLRAKHAVACPEDVADEFVAVLLKMRLVMARAALEDRLSDLDDIMYRHGVQVSVNVVEF